MNKPTIFSILAVAVIALIVGMNVSSNARDIRQAQAAIEAAKAAQISASGLADTSRMLAFILVVLTITVVALIGVVVYLALSRRTPPKQTWAPGPNARWGRKQLPAPQVDPVQAMLQMYLADKLPRQQQATQYTEAQYVEEQDEISW